MPTIGSYDLSYLNKLKAIKILIIGEYKGAKQHHLMECMICSHRWEATPISKIANHSKSGFKGCPQCTVRQKYKKSRQSNLTKLINKGFEIISEYDGSNCTSKQSIGIPVTVRNVQCGHTFTSSSKNLLSRNVNCPICAREYKNSVITASSKIRSQKWALSAPEWKRYRSEVTKLTRLAYRKHKSSINPTNLPTGRAGTEGAYHLDHIVPVRYCFDNNIPVTVCAHWSNLQMLGWRDNVGSRDKLKEGVEVPKILQQYIS